MTGNSRPSIRKKLSTAEQQVSAFAALRKISLALNSAVYDLGEIVPLILSKACELVSANHGSLVLIRSDEETLQIVSVVGDDWTPEAQSCSLRLGVGITGRVAQTGEIYLCNNTLVDPYYFSLFPNVRSELAVPVRCRGVVVGLINLDSEAVNGFTQNDIELLSMMADHAGIALQNARQLAEAMAARKEWEDIFQAACDGRLVCKQDLTIDRVNRSFQEMLHLQSEELIGHSIELLATKFPCFANGSQLLEQLKTRGRIEEKLPLNGADRSFQISGTGASLNGKPVFLLNFQETTRFDQLQDQISKSEKMAALGQMVAGVAHELNNPLQTVFGYSELLLQNPNSPKLHHWLGSVQIEAQRASKLVRTLLTYSRNSPPELEMQPIVPFLQTILNDWRRLYQDPTVAVTVELSPEETIINVDRFQMEQVFHNLLNNAQQALLDTQAVDARITVKTIVKAKTVQFVVGDNGPGIESSNLEKLFRPFFTTKKNGQGTGLGLAICQNLVERNGGRIWCESEPGVETRFKIEIPCTSNTAVKPPALHGDPSARPRILLVDDETAIRELIKEVLTEDGSEVDAARNAAAALDLIGINNYKLILCDINMPQVSGIDFYRKMARERPEMARLFVFVTGNPILDPVRVFGSPTHPECIQKPFEINYLKSFVRSKLAIHNGFD